MENKNNQSPPPNFTLSEAEAVPRFAPAQMLDCAVCHRANPPTRSNCFYCGAELETAEVNKFLARSAGRKLENWEKGFNVVRLNGAANLAVEKINETAIFLRLEKSDLARIVESETTLPLVRVETIDEAELIKKRLEEIGLKCAIVSDSALEIEKSPRRVRAFEFAENTFAARLSGGDAVSRLNWSDLRLLVVGMITEHKRESAGRRKRGETSESIEAGEISTDEKVLDFYSENDSQGWRVSSKSFDFSCLGERKKLLANENFHSLLEFFRQCAPNAVFDENYRKSRRALSSVWEIEERKESTGWQHEGIGKLSIGSLTTASNAVQFLRYSRMLREISRHNEK